MIFALIEKMKEHLEYYNEDTYVLSTLTEELNIASNLRLKGTRDGKLRQVIGRTDGVHILLLFYL